MDIRVSWILGLLRVIEDIRVTWVIRVKRMLTEIIGVSRTTQVIKVMYLELLGFLEFLGLLG